MSRGADLSPAELDALWAVRRDVVDFLPGKDLEADRAQITRRLARADTVCTMRDAEGHVQGLWMADDLVLDADRERCVVFHVDQWFVREAHRGDPTIPLSIVRYGLRMLPRHWRARWFIAGITGPMSYIFMQRWIRPVWTLADPELPARERALLEALLVRYDVDSRDHLVPSLALMPEPPPHYHERADLRAMLQRYERFNPRWREGWALPMIAAVDVRILRVLLRRSARRFVGRTPVLPCRP